MEQAVDVPLVWFPRQRVRELTVLGPCLVLKDQSFGERRLRGSSSARPAGLLAGILTGHGGAGGEGPRAPSLSAAGRVPMRGAGAA